MSEPTAQVAKAIHASTPDVWAAITTPATLKKFFFGADVESDWKVGSPIRMTGEFKGRTYQDKGDILVADPERCLSFSHWSAMSGKPDAPENYHIVTFDLVAETAGTTVTLTQANLTGGVTASDVALRPHYEKSWAIVLDGLAKVFHGKALHLPRRQPAPR